MKKSFNIYEEFDEQYFRKITSKYYGVISEDYVNFLKECNGGIPGKSKFLFFKKDGRKDVSEVSVFFGVHSGPNTSSLQWVLEIYRSRLPKKLMPIADDYFGNLICLGVTGSYNGKIFFWNHDEESNEVGWHNVYHINDSFFCFFNSLEKIPDEDDKDIIIELFECEDYDKIKNMINDGVYANNYQTLSKIAELAAKKNNIDLIEFVVSKGADYSGALSGAISSGNEDLCIMLVEKMGGRVQIGIDAGTTWLHIVAETNLVKLAAKLVKAGVNVNAKDVDKYRALTLAIAEGQDEMATFLKSVGGIESDFDDIF